MKKKNKKPLRFDDDSEAMRHVIDKLLELDYDVHRPGPHHLKIGQFNYYPTTGRTTIDPATVHPRLGLRAFLELLQESRKEPILVLELE